MAEIGQLYDARGNGMAAKPQPARAQNQKICTWFRTRQITVSVVQNRQGGSGCSDDRPVALNVSACSTRPE